MYFRKNLILQRIFFAILERFLNQNISGASVKSEVPIEHELFQKF